MNTFWARIRLNDEENAQELLKAFFAEEFSSQNKILIKGKRIFVEVFFDEAPPAEIATIIGGYSDIDFGYGKLPDEYLEDNYHIENKEDTVTVGKEEATAMQGSKREVAQLKETAADEAVMATGTENAAQPKEMAAEEADTITVTEATAQPQEMVTDEAVIQGDGSDFKRSKKAPDNIPKLDEIAQRTFSFDKFINAVAEWLEFGKRTQLFKELVKIAIKIEHGGQKVTWGNMLAIAKSQEGFEVTTNDKIALTRKVATKLDEIQCNGSILSVIKLTAGYYYFDFRSNINIKNKARDILVKMGLEDKSHEEQDLILRIATEGVCVAFTINPPNEINMHSLCHSIGVQDPDVAQMTFSTFVNDFYRANHNKEMRAKDFIMKLYEMIVTGEEKF